MIEYVPLGGIILWYNANDIPNGFVICDGRTDNNYTTPDLRGKFVIGYDTRDSRFSDVDNSGGSFSIEQNNLPTTTDSSTNPEQVYTATTDSFGTVQYTANDDYIQPYYVLIYVMRTSNVSSRLRSIYK